MKIFVSYTTRDDDIQNNYLLDKYSLLSKYGDVYIDLLHNDSVEKQKRVFDELATSNLLVVIESESINDSKWVKREVKMAQEKQIPIIKLAPNFTINTVENKLKKMANDGFLPNKYTQLL